MKFFLDFFPLAIFVGIYFFSGAENPMHAAVIGLIIASFIQTIGTRLITGKFEKLHLWILLLTVVLGGMTLLFRDPLFIQWKATAVAWLTALVFLYRQLISKKPIIQSMMEKAFSEDDKGESTAEPSIQIPDSTWKSINYSWPIGYLLFGFLNLYVAFNFSEAFWVKFKLFGLLAMTLVLFAFTLYKIFPFIPKESEASVATDADTQTKPIESEDRN